MEHQILICYATSREYFVQLWTQEARGVVGLFVFPGERPGVWAVGEKWSGQVHSVVSDVRIADAQARARDVSWGGYAETPARNAAGCIPGTRGI